VPGTPSTRRSCGPLMTLGVTGRTSATTRRKSLFGGASSITSGAILAIARRKFAIYRAIGQAPNGSVLPPAVFDAEPGEDRTDPGIYLTEITSLTHWESLCGNPVDHSGKDRGNIEFTSFVFSKSADSSPLRAAPKSSYWLTISSRPRCVRSRSPHTGSIRRALDMERATLMPPSGPLSGNAQQPTPGWHTYGRVVIWDRSPIRRRPCGREG
jgi:hypothetical protein